MGPRGQEPHGLRRPPELEECLRRLSRDEAAVAELRALREARARADPVKAFCRRCQDGPLEARELREGQLRAGWPEKRAELLPAAARPGSSFPRTAGASGPVKWTSREGLVAQTLAKATTSTSSRPAASPDPRRSASAVNSTGMWPGKC